LVSMGKLATALFTAVLLLGTSLILFVWIHIRHS
jgi:hypothetical protein